MNEDDSHDAWEQRKLGDLGYCQSGVGFPGKEQGGNAGIPFFKVSDMNIAGNEEELITANNYVSTEQIEKNGWNPIEKTSIVFAKVGAAIYQNRKRLVKQSFLLDNNTMAYILGNDWDTLFCKVLFDRVDLAQLVQVGALPSYNATDVESIPINMPKDIEEQSLIGHCISQMNILITLHQCKSFISELFLLIALSYNRFCNIDDWICGVSLWMFSIVSWNLSVVLLIS